MRQTSLGWIIAAVFTVCAGTATAGPAHRFFLEGDGRLDIRSTKNNETFKGRYRSRNGRYRTKALRAINRVFDGSFDKPQARVSLRLIEVLSLLQQRLHHRTIVISSGYRSPAYNQALRDKGGTVALASLHQYGMAADLRVEGVSGKRLWRLARKLRIGGAGYYGNDFVHIDVGPTRFWTQSTANVRAGVSVDNKRIMLVVEYDIYRPGEPVHARFARMTALPIGVAPTFTLVRATSQAKASDKISEIRPRLARGLSQSSCPQFREIAELADLRWVLPADLPAGHYRLQAHACDERWPAMPRDITSPAFEVR